MYLYSLQSIDIPINLQVTFHHLLRLWPLACKSFLGRRALTTPIVMGTFGNLTCLFSVFPAIALERLLLDPLRR